VHTRVPRHRVVNSNSLAIPGGPLARPHGPLSTARTPLPKMQNFKQVDLNAAYGSLVRPRSSVRRGCPVRLSLEFALFNTGMARQASMDVAALASGRYMSRLMWQPDTALPYW
jgi:hypothetical protein